eukprot:1102616-Amphidinium_carterae.1
MHLTASGAPTRSEVLSCAIARSSIWEKEWLKLFAALEGNAGKNLKQFQAYALEFGLTCLDVFQVKEQDGVLRWM